MPIPRSVCAQDPLHALKIHRARSPPTHACNIAPMPARVLHLRLCLRYAAPAPTVRYARACTHARGALHMPARVLRSCPWGASCAPTHTGRHYVHTHAREALHAPTSEGALCAPARPLRSYAHKSLHASPCFVHFMHSIFGWFIVTSHYLISERFEAAIMFQIYRKDFSKGERRVGETKMKVKILRRKSIVNEELRKRVPRF